MSKGYLETLILRNFEYLDNNKIVEELVAKKLNSCGGKDSLWKRIFNYLLPLFVLLSRAAIDGAETVTMRHLETARDKVLMGPERKARLPDEEANLITAYHEGGHAIVAYYTKVQTIICTFVEWPLTNFLLFVHSGISSIAQGHDNAQRTFLGSYSIHPRKGTLSCYEGSTACHDGHNDGWQSRRGVDIRSR